MRGAVEVIDYVIFAMEKNNVQRAINIAEDAGFPAAIFQNDKQSIFWDYEFWFCLAKGLGLGNDQEHYNYAMNIRPLNKTITVDLMCPPWIYLWTKFTHHMASSDDLEAFFEKVCSITKTQS